MAAEPRRFAIRFWPWAYPLLWILGLGRAFSWVDVADTEVRVRMGWGFRGTIARTAIRSAKRERDMWWGVGVHTNFRGGWLVNGSPRGIVGMDLDPPQRCRMAFIPIRVRWLGLALVEPDGFLRALGRG